MHTSSLIEYGVATLTLAGETESGDLHLVRPIPTGVLMSVVDGLGHGADAATAARIAIVTLDRCAAEPLPSLVRHCHEALVGTRGVVMSLAFLDGARRALTWLGVGNVEGVLLHGDSGAGAARTRLLTRGGIVGSELPGLRTEAAALARGDTLIFATDGIREGFVDDLPANAAPQRMADHILARHNKGTDDALVLVARYTSRMP